MEALHIIGEEHQSLAAILHAVRYMLKEVTAGRLAPDLKLFLTVGILGGFTTFSTFSLDVALLVERHSWPLAALYVGLSVTLSVGALFAAMAAIRQMVG